MSNPLFCGIGISLAVVILCVVGHFVVFRSRRRDLQSRIAREVHKTTHHVGAWMIEVRAGMADEIGAAMCKLATRTEPPERIVDVLRDAGGRVLAHLTGPGAELEEHARAWIEGVARRVSTVGVPQLGGAKPNQFIVVAYASAEPPPASHQLSDIREHLVCCVSAALVLCKAEKLVFVQERGEWFRYLGLAGACVTLALTIFAALPGETPAKLPEATTAGRSHNPAPAIDGGGALADRMAPPQSELDARKGAAEHPISPASTESGQVATASTVDAGSPKQAPGPAKTTVIKKRDTSDAGAKAGHTSPRTDDVAVGTAPTLGVDAGSGGTPLNTADASSPVKVAPKPVSAPLNTTNASPPVKVAPKNGGGASNAVGASAPARVAPKNVSASSRPAEPNSTGKGASR